jgi:DNA-binding transcriptional MerR regulator
MAYTVKRVSEMSGVSVRTLHFYDETGLLKPAYKEGNGYRYYKEPQLLKLQQILFYRELGFELKEIKRIVSRRGFARVGALQSHRKVLESNLSRTRRLIDTVDKTIKHLKGKTKMKSEELFAGFTVAAGNDRFGEQVRRDGLAVDCKVSAKDTAGAMSVFELAGGWPRHSHADQDEWVYIVDGQFEFIVGEKRFRAGVGESVFLPRRVSHVWSPLGHGKVINVYQPAGKMEDFFRVLANFQEAPTREEVINKTYTEEQTVALNRLFASYGMDLLGPPIIPE